MIYLCNFVIEIMVCRVSCVAGMVEHYCSCSFRIEDFHNSLINIDQLKKERFERILEL